MLRSRKRMPTLRNCYGWRKNPPHACPTRPGETFGQVNRGAHTSGISSPSGDATHSSGRPQALPWGVAALQQLAGGRSQVVECQHPGLARAWNADSRTWNADARTWNYVLLRILDLKCHLQVAKGHLVSFACRPFTTWTLTLYYAHLW
jgi:hypothetical protein